MFTYSVFITVDLSKFNFLSVVCVFINVYLLNTVYLFISAADLVKVIYLTRYFRNQKNKVALFRDLINFSVINVI